MPGIRSFIALPSTSELKNVLGILQETLKKERADVKWDTPDKFHITLKFLGNVEAETLDTLAGSIASATAEMEAFRLTYRSVGAFPDLIHPRVLWVGTDSSDTLTSLQQRVESLCERLGFPAEEKAFHPHITLGRIKGSFNLSRLTAEVKSITFEPVQTDCSELLLIKSDLRPTGSVYTTLKSFPLKA
jgi:2'-5' RNA ligase